jgi:hypothetical protein
LHQQELKTAWKNPRRFFVPMIRLERGFSTASTFEFTGPARIAQRPVE